MILSNSLWKRVAAAEFTNVALVVKHLRLTPLDEVRGGDGLKRGAGWRPGEYGEVKWGGS